MRIIVSSKGSRVFILILESLALIIGWFPNTAECVTDTSFRDSSYRSRRIVETIDMSSNSGYGLFPILLAGGAITRISWNLEDPQRIRRFFDQNAFGITDVGDVYGDGLFLGAGLLGVTAAARLTGNQRLNEFSSDLSRSLLMSSTATWVLKLSVGRKRPNGGPHSFPSGHTSAAFCVAPVIARHFGWKAAVPAYILAGFTGISRMEDRKHYLSDVFFGAAIGLAAGDAITDGGIGTHLLEYIDIGLDSVGLSFRF